MAAQDALMQGIIDAINGNTAELRYWFGGEANLAGYSGQPTGGNVASAATDSGNPVKVAGVYKSTLDTYTTGQRAQWAMGSRGAGHVELWATDAATPATIGSTADTTAAVVGLFTWDQNMLFNGATWDRVRSGGVTGMAGVSIQASPSGGYSISNITTATTTTVKSGAGTLHGINVNTKGTVASTVTVYDNTAGSGTKIATLDSLNLSGWNQFDVAFATGLTLVTTGTAAPDITVSYK